MLTPSHEGKTNNKFYNPIHLPHWLGLHSNLNTSKVSSHSTLPRLIFLVSTSVLRQLCALLLLQLTAPINVCRQSDPKLQCDLFPAQTFPTTSVCFKVDLSSLDLSIGVSAAVTQKNISNIPDRVVSMNQRAS